MSVLSRDEIKLHGGCYCSTVRYTVTIPPYSEREIIQARDDKSGKEEIRYPSINLDHCNDCRKANATLVPSWIICPMPWIKWSILSSKEPLPVPNGLSEDTAGERIEMSSEEYVQRPASLEGLVTTFNSSPETWRTFCTRCGSNLSFVCLEKREGVRKMDLTLGSLDRKSLELPGIKPTAHYYCRHGIQWVRDLLEEGDLSLIGKKLPRYPGVDRGETM